MQLYKEMKLMSSQKVNVILNQALMKRRMRRLTSDSSQHVFTRSIESDEHRFKRLAHDREHHNYYQRI